MKIFTKVVIDIESGEILHEESYEYEGPLALADISTAIAGIGAAGALAGGVGSLFGSSSGGRASSRAAEAQIAAANRAADLQWQEYQQTRADLSPWRTTGGQAVNYLGGILNIPGSAPVDPTSALRATPGYNWAMGQGVDARERSAAARGGLLSTPEQKSLTTFGQGLADQTYQNYLNNLFNVSGSGLSAAGMAGQAGMNYANQAGMDYMAGGQAQAQGLLNAYNAQQSGYNALGGGVGMAAALLGSGGRNSPINYLSGLIGNTSGYGGGGGGVDLSQNYLAAYGQNPYWKQ